VPKGRKKGEQEQQQRINPVEEFGKQLEAAGFAKHGQETMISGVTGQEMPCNIYIGLVYYQRLRHMVSDKFQVGCGGSAPFLNLEATVLFEGGQRSIILLFGHAINGLLAAALVLPPNVWPL
jgi:hypothetical protein